MASTRPKRDSVLMEKPNSGKSTNVPTSETGTASSGIKVARQLCKEEIDDQDHQREGDQKRLTTISLMPSRDRARRVQGDDEIQVRREALLHLGHQLPDACRGIDCVRARQLIDSNHGARLSAKTSSHAIVLRTQLDASDIAHPDGAPVGGFAHDDLPEFFRRRKAALARAPNR
jgi:hypothetical protein